MHLEAPPACYRVAPSLLVAAWAAPGFPLPRCQAALTGYGRSVETTFSKLAGGGGHGRDLGHEGVQAD